MAVDWTEERVETLKRLWLDGATARQIAEILGEGVTRNAVIGKANRLGLSKPSKSSVTRKQRKREQQVKVEAPPIVGTATMVFGVSIGLVLGELSVSFHSCIVGGMLIIAGRNGDRF